MSELFCGARTTMSRKRIPKIHKPTIDRLLAAMDEVLKTVKTKKHESND